MIVVNGPDLPLSGGDRSAPIELIDLVFALSNVKLVREIVKDNLRHLEELGDVSKGQTEGVRHLMIDRQNQVYNSLYDVEQVLTGLLKAGMTEGGVRPVSQPSNRDISLNQGQSQALIYALSFAIGHLMKFMPGPRGGEVPGTIA